ncbi:isocyanide synthase family protein [Legionella saoudiensis]|uniref:isocyanide synthase family protein n=1 Tax=Legionella saoudiensis TaxID=1750561 RepID=UPI00072FED73|nr:isocyanide synthase family protein [Legionella saoudiensis]
MSATEETTQQLLSLIMSQRRVSEAAEKTCQGITCNQCSKLPRVKIQQAIRDERMLTLILPAFPAKSANRQKTLSARPDRGEVMGLTQLNQLCHNMQKIHLPGVKLIICSDGRVFNDLVLVSDADVDLYQQGIQNIISEHKLHHLTIFNLDEVYPSHNYKNMRELLLQEFGQSLASLKQRIIEEPHWRYQFNGLHRFISEDQLALKPQQSKNKIRQQAKEITYEVMRRSNAWSALIAQHFSQSIRLSIHPQPCGSEKMGIQFIPSSNRWCTPWHNVLLKDAQGWQLIKREEAERLGARLNEDHYVLEAS